MLELLYAISISGNERLRKTAQTWLFGARCVLLGFSLVRREVAMQIITI
jgi:hypothetical protein